MPRSSWTPAVLNRLARNNLPTINRLWETFGHNNILLGNAIRSLFGLPNISLAFQLYQASLAFAGTAAGNAALGMRPALNLGDYTLNPSLQSPFGQFGRLKQNIHFELNGDHFTITIWSDTALSGRQINEAVSDFIGANLGKYVSLALAFHSGNMTPTDVRLTLAERRW